MERSKSKGRLLKYIEEMKKIHEALLLFLEDSGEFEEDFYNFRDLKDILMKQKILSKKQKLKSFLLLILNICNNHQRSPVFFSKIERILEFLEQTVKKTFSNDQIFNIFSSNKIILLFLFERKIISVNQKIYEYFLQENRKNYCHFLNLKYNQKDFYLVVLFVFQKAK